MAKITAEQVAWAIGTDEFSELLLIFLSEEFSDLSFNHPEDHCAEDVDFQNVTDLTVEDNFAFATVDGSYSEMIPTSCCDVAMSERVSFSIQVSICLKSPFHIEIEVLDEDWPADEDGDYY